MIIHTNRSTWTNILGGLFCSLITSDAQPVIVNGGFEIDTLPPHPGYGGITGWHADPGSYYGLNEANGFFADNGLIPEGKKVAFIQGPGSIFQEVDGFVVGKKYWVEYAENTSERCCSFQRGILTVVADEVTIVPDHSVAVVGGSGDFKHVTSKVFVALDTQVRITFVTGGGAEDSTVLIDAVEVFSEDFLEVRLSVTEETVFPKITVHGLPGSTVEILGSNSLGAEANWELVQEVRLSAAALGVVTDMSGTPGPTRYYRARAVRLESTASIFRGIVFPLCLRVFV